MKTLFFSSLIGFILLCFFGCSGDFSPVPQFGGEWRGIFGNDSIRLSLSSSGKGVVGGTAIFWRNSTRIVGAFDGVADHAAVKFSISFPAFSIAGEGTVLGERFAGEFSQWHLEQDEFRKPHIVFDGGGSFLLGRK